MKNLINIQKVAAYWWTDEAHIRTRISNGSMPMPKLTNGLARWDEAILKQWEADGYPRSPEPSWKKMCEILQAIHREAEALDENQKKEHTDEF
ncbi:MAG: hypothetical protein KKE86_11660 [Planctomycetes bacterium]|nr:hypothetical protein [Planctomycetota bacterium]MBU4399977.1 hypothetical protein [Planctomycetota bacterium]MCG2683830.1 hypothetical protein [Planctomycetales bacterium]